MLIVEDILKYKQKHFGRLGPFKIRRQKESKNLSKFKVSSNSFFKKTLLLSLSLSS